ncbi:MAG: sulfatase [Planctomycetaceae bacterium]|nr:sulfatase [Planctomycetaceae bacterium]
MRSQRFFLQLIAAGLLNLTAASQSPAADRPNVILFIADDVSWNDYGCYGNPAARTPNIDALAENGIRFDRAFLTASSCSPSRSSIITGRYPHNNGAAAELHSSISGHLPWFPEILRAAGYYTALSGKHHMKSTAPDSGPQARPVAFDHVDGGRGPGNSGGHANWVSVVQQRPKSQPFFCWFASYDAHRDWDGDKQWEAARFGPQHRPEDVVVPPFLSDDAETRDDLASYYNEVTRFDYFIGEVVGELRKQNVLENTLILVMADNGRPFPRAKTRVHDSGMKTALVAHWPKGIQRSGSCRSLVSAIDLAPTILSAAGCDVPETMQGVSLRPLLSDPTTVVRQYVFSEHNWHDYEAHGRAVRHNEFLLVRNHRPLLPWQGPADSVRSPSHQALLTLQQGNRLSPAQQDVFLTPRPTIELYNTATDPNQLNNLSDDPSVRDTRDHLISVLDQWTEETKDSAPQKLRPDEFDRRTGTRLPKNAISADGAVTPGADLGADRTNAPGPR